jgi:hypothetical protein
MGVLPIFFIVRVLLAQRAFMPFFTPDSPDQAYWTVYLYIS